MRSFVPDAALSTSVIEPGTRLAGRYRLDDRVSEAGGSTFWKATDEILARSVAVLTFDPGFPRVGDVVTAARSASRLTDPRLTQVFDADDSGERAYVVSEWVTGDTLRDLLAQGAMEPDRAAAFVLEAAEALTSAHAAGLGHLCLTPHNLVWTSGGTVKITGLGVDAVLSDAVSDTPAQEDARGLAGMLYAALTGHWPGSEGTGLPPAPAAPDGGPLAPGQVRPGIPHNLDAIVCRALRIGRRGLQEPLDSPSAFAAALARVPRSPLPFVPLVGSTPPAVVPRPETREHRAQATPPSPVPPTQTVPDGGRLRHSAPVRRASSGQGPFSKPVLGAIAAVAVMIIVVGGWGLSQLGGGGGGDKNRTRPNASASQAVKQQPKELTPVKTTVDNDPPKPDGTAPKDTGKAIDDSKSSYWTTQHYLGSADFGGLRQGVGLVLDMGKQVTVDKVTVIMPSGSPGAVELHIGGSGNHTDPRVDNGPAVGTFDLNGHHTKGQYVTLWFTKLPDIGKYQVKVKDVKVYGTD